jgi:hypothetical protein
LREEEAREAAEDAEAEAEAQGGNHDGK